nr:ornithine carbamoyltransferase [Longirhabdus pacifica]
MQAQLKGRDFLALNDFSSSQLQHILHEAEILKKQHKNGQQDRSLEGKIIGLIFEKASTRTRVSFEVGILQLGGKPLFLSKNDLQLGRGEPLSDTGKVLSRYLDGIMIRTYAHDTVIELARNATIPVINGLTDLAHPCQALADFHTIKEKKGKLKGLKLTYIGDGNNMAHSLMMAGAKLGVDIAIATPPGYEPDASISKLCKNAAVETGATLQITNNPVQAVQGADIIYTDVWASMGQEQEQQSRETAFQSYQVNRELLKHAKNDYLFMHCLPAHRGEEVAADIIDGPQSIIFDQAENRLHVQKAIMKSII